jgi:hypothetical protein
MPEKLEHYGTALLHSKLGLILVKMKNEKHFDQKSRPSPFKPTDALFKNSVPHFVLTFEAILGL